jgi:hypothetical protein
MISSRTGQRLALPDGTTDLDLPAVTTDGCGPIVAHTLDPSHREKKCRIYLTDPVTLEPFRFLADGTGEGPPDGWHLYIRESYLYAVKLDEGRARFYEPAGRMIREVTGFREPRMWSPEGDRLYGISEATPESQFFVQYLPEPKVIGRLPYRVDKGGSRGTWSSDGKRLYAWLASDEQETAQLFQLFPGIRPIPDAVVDRRFRGGWDEVSGGEALAIWRAIEWATSPPAHILVLDRDSGEVLIGPNDTEEAKLQGRMAWTPEPVMLPGRRLVWGGKDGSIYVTDTESHQTRRVFPK